MADRMRKSEAFKQAYAAVVAALWSYRVKQITVASVKQLLPNNNKHMGRPIVREMQRKWVVSPPRTEHGDNVHIVNLEGLDRVLGTPPEIIEDSNEQSGIHSLTSLGSEG